jgi:tetratricopeptide (TPR) repeat protein
LKRLSEKISGSLKDRPLVEVIGWVFANSMQGELAVNVRKAEYKIFFFKGMPFYANSSLSSDNIFEMLVGMGKLDRDDVPSLERMVGQGASPEKALLEMGVVGSTDIYGMQQLMVKELIIRACGHRSGTFKFKEMEASELEGLPMYDISPLAVIYEAINRFMLAELPEKVQKMSGSQVSLNPNVHELENLPEIFYQRTYLLDDFARPMSVQDAVGLLLREFKDLNQALTFFYVMYSTGILMISEAKKAPEEKPRPAPEPAVSRGTEKEKKPAREEAPASSDYIFVTGRKRKKHAPEKTPEPEAVKEEEPKAVRPEPQPPEPDEAAVPEAVPGGKMDHKRKLDLLETLFRSTGDHLQMFGVKPESPIPEIELALFKLLKQYEIDEIMKGPDPELAARAAEVKAKISEAFNILTNAEQRDAYEKSMYPEEFKRAYTLPLKRELARWQFLRGRWFLDHQRADLALVRFEKSVELDPEQADYFAYTGWAMYRANKGSMPEIEGYLKQALKLSSRSDEAYYFLGLIAKRENNEDLADEYFQKALVINPQNRSAARELDTIKKNKERGIFGKIFSRRK